MAGSRRGRNSGRTQRQRIRQKQKKTGATGIVAATSKAAKDVATVKSGKTTKSQKQAAQKRLNQHRTGRSPYFTPAKSAYRARMEKQQQRKKERAKAVKKEQRSAFEKFVDAARKKISSGDIQHVGRMRGSQAALEAYVAQRKAKQAAEEKKSLEKTNKDVTQSYHDAYKARLNSPKKMSSSKRSALGDAEKNMEQQRKEDAAKELNKKLTRIGAKGLVRQQKDVKATSKEIKKVAKSIEKKDRDNKYTNEDILKMQNAARMPAGTGQNAIDKKLKNKTQYNTQRELDKGSPVIGLLDSLSIGESGKEAIERTYGIKLDDSKAKTKAGYNIGGAAGFLIKALLTGGAAEGAVAGAIGKSIAKKTGKELTKKGKFLANRAAEGITSAPVNIDQSARDSENVKEFGKNLAKNMALDATFGGALDGVAAISKGIKIKRTRDAVTKVEKGKTLSKAERDALKKAASKVIAKQISKRELTATEKLVEKNMDKVKSALSAKLEPEATKDAVKAETVNAGRVTSIKEPYEGKVPEQKSKPKKVINVKPVSVTKAQRNIDEAGENRSLLKKVYEKVFADEGGSRTIPVKDTLYDGKPYNVFLGKKAIGKVVSDVHMSPEKLAIFDNINEIIENAEYVGSGNYVKHGAKEKDTVRFDYFENEVNIDGNKHIVSFDVEVFPSSNNYRTHKIVKMDLKPLPSTDVGPVPTALGKESSPLNHSIPDSPQKINTETENIYAKESKEQEINSSEVLNKPKTAKDFKDESPENMYKKATEGVSDSEVGQHYKKLKKQILEDLGEDSDFIKELNLAESNGRFNKKKIMPQDKARAQAKEEVQANFDATYKKVLDASDGDDEHLFYARATEVVKKLRDDIERGVNESEATKKLIEAVQKSNDFASAAGRALNSTKMILMASPEGRLRVADRELKRLNERFSERLNGEKIELSEEQISKILKAETDEQIERTMKEINVEIWDQIPATTFEKINELRHFSMLANIKTHLRNLAGNTFFKSARSISDGIEVALNKVAKEKIERMGGTAEMVASSRKAIRKNNEYLEKVFKKEYEASGSKTKYMESIRPEGSKTIKFAPINAAIQGNYKLLELEDMLAFKPEYKKGYIRWCKAHNIDTSDLSKLTKRQHEAANAFAIKRAEEATFRDASALSEWLTRTKSTLAGKKGNSALGTAAYRAGNMMLESQLPFVKTPINVFRRSVDYSPIGLVRGVAELMAAKDVEVFKQGLHHLSTGLTGTGVFALGIFLNSKDLITLETGSKSGSEYYDRDMGFQDYSIKLGSGKYSATIDWASPMNVSLFMGAQVGDLMSQDGLGFTDVLKGLSSATTKPMLDMSFMSSAKDTVEMFMEQAYDYETGKINYMDAALQALGGSVPQGYMGSFIPQFVSQAAQASDTKQRDTRSTKEDPLAKSWDSWRRKMINRIPVLREYCLNPKIDRFGDDKVTGGNVMTRILNAFINPSNVKEIKFTDTDKELINIYKHLPEETSSEKKSKQFFFYNFTGNPSYDLGDGKRMNYKELYGYGKEKRKQQTALIESMTGSSSYKNMTWGMKAEEVNKSHWISQAVADKETYGDEFAANKIAETGSEPDKRALNLFRKEGGRNKDFVDFYITKEKLLARSHDTDYHTKALAVALSGNETMGKIYDINVDKVKTAQEYLKKGGSESEYATAMCNVISKIDKAEVSVSKANKAVSAAYFKINKRTYKAMGLSKEKANMGIGLKKYKYKFETLEKMKSDSKYSFDEDESGSLNKEEMTSYINSLEIKDNIEKACLFEYLFPYDSRNPFGSIPNYLDMEDDDNSGGGYGSRGYRRYGRGYGRYGRGSGGSGSSAEEMTEFEKYAADLLKKIQSRKIEKATMQYKKLNTKKYSNDQYRKAIVKLLAKKIMEK